MRADSILKEKEKCREFLRPILESTNDREKLIIMSQLSLEMEDITYSQRLYAIFREEFPEIFISALEDGDK